MYKAIFSDGYEDYSVIQDESPRTLWRVAHMLLRYDARFITPENFVHVDFPELGITASRFTIPEDRSEDGRLHTTTVIERTVF